MLGSKALETFRIGRILPLVKLHEGGSASNGATASSLPKKRSWINFSAPAPICSLGDAAPQALSGHIMVLDFNRSHTISYL